MLTAELFVGLMVQCDMDGLHFTAKVVEIKEKVVFVDAEVLDTPAFHLLAKQRWNPAFRDIEPEGVMLVLTKDELKEIE